MTKNVVGIDKTIRIVVGTAILIAGFAMHSWWGLIGIVPLITAAVGFCPAYTLFCSGGSCGTQAKGACCGGHEHDHEAEKKAS